MINCHIYDLHFGQGSFDSLSSFKSVKQGHTNIDEDHIGLQSFSCLDQTSSVMNHRHDVKIVCKQFVKGLGDENVIIGDQNAWAAGGEHGDLPSNGLSFSFWRALGTLSTISPENGKPPPDDKQLLFLPVALIRGNDRAPCHM